MKVTRFRPPSLTKSELLKGRRVQLRPLSPEDYREWKEVRKANEEWLTK